MTIIRPVEPRDLPAVRAALVEAWHATYDALIGAERVSALTDTWHSPRALARELTDPECVFLLAEVAGRVIAVSTAKAEPSGAVKLSRLYLVPSAQGRGLGKRLMDETLAPFGRTAVWLTAHSGNSGAIGFYRRYGFVVTGMSGDDAEAVVMRRPLGFPPRPVRDDDAQDLFGLLTLCFADYPGCYTDPHDDLRDILRPATRAREAGARFWVVDDERGRICACVSVDFPSDGTAELHRLYVRPDMRRTGLGAGLVGIVEAEALRQGATRIVFWSDARFTNAHRLYERMGYARHPGERDIGDISQSREFFFEKALDYSGTAGGRNAAAR
jgi:GNAT superfamily N-acetyltransferase